MRKLAGTEVGAVLRHLPEWPCILVHEEEGGGGAWRRGDVPERRRVEDLAARRRTHPKL